MAANTATAATLQGATFTYFPMPGRGETVRLLLALGHVAFTDNRVPGKDWGALKPSTPWGQMPFLTLRDGRTLAQARAVARFVAQHVGMYPADFYQAARVDELLDALEDIGGINGVGRGKEQAEKEADRLAAVSPGGKIHALLTKIDAFIGEHGDGAGHSVGNALTVADVHVFSVTSNLGSGFFDGVPNTVTDSFKNIQRVRQNVSNTDEILAWYAKAEAAGRSEFCRKIEANFVAAKDIDLSSL
jgi:prostaglandin-H2 D-isomerase / glutathione transferase